MVFVIAWGVCFFYSAACLCLGLWLLQMLGHRLDGENPPGSVLELGSAFLLGQGSLAAVWQVLGVVGQFSLPVIVGILCLGLIIGANPTWHLVGRFRQGLRAAFQDLWANQPLRAKALILLALLLVLSYALIVALPPTPRGDALAFYMAIAKLTAVTERLVPLPGYELFSQVTLQGELHFAALMAMGSPIAAKLFVWPTATAAGLMLMSLAREAGVGRYGQWLALAALFTSTAFTSVIGDGKTDIFSTAMGIGAFCWALRTGPTNRSTALRLTGLFSGLAIAAKITYVVPLPPSIALIVVWRYLVCNRLPWRSRSFTRSLLAVLFWLGFWAGLPLLPHVIKNTVLFGEPLAPLISRNGAAITEQTWFGAEVTRRIVLTYPFAITYGQYPMQGGNISALVLAYAPLALLTGHVHRRLMESPLVQLTVAALVGVVLWVILRPAVIAPRFLMASLLAFVPLAVAGAERVLRQDGRSKALRLGVWLSAAVVLLVSLSTIRLPLQNALSYMAGAASECSFEASNLDGSCRASALVNAQADHGARVYLATYYRYWLRPDLLQCLPTSDELTRPTTIAAPQERWAYLYQQGFRFLIFDTLTHHTYADALHPEDVPDWLEVVRLFEKDSFLAYRLDSKDPARQPKVNCQPVTDRIWQAAER